MLPAVNMRRLCPLLVFFLVLVSTGHSLSWELGAVAGAGPCLSYGSYLDSRQAALAELGSTTPGKPGSSKGELFLGWTIGGYVEAGILDWLAVRAEPRLLFMGASSLALTDAGDSFDRYGYYFYGVELPILSRFKLALGPGRVCLSLGPFLAITASGLTVVDRYASSSTTATIPPAFYLGLSGGAGYSLAMGPGTCTLEARADWALTSAASKASLSGDIFSLGLNLMLGYGFPIGGGGK